MLSKKEDRELDLSVLPGMYLQCGKGIREWVHGAERVGPSSKNWYQQSDKVRDIWLTEAQLG